jgi:hypothetical protein
MNLVWEPGTWHQEKKGVKWDINYNFSEKITMTIAAETVLREDIIGKV